MKNRTDETKKDVIEKLIATEEEESLARFRASEFEMKIRTKVRGISKHRERLSLRQTVPAAVWIGLASAILVGAVVFLIIPKKTPGPDMAQMIAAVLRQTPRIQAIEGNAIAEAAPQNEVASPLEQRILSTLLGGIKNPESNRSLNWNPPPWSAKPKSRFLSLEETYKILVIDKAVEHLLVLMTS